MNRFTLLLFVFGTCLLLTGARRPPGFDEKDLLIRWQLLGNNYRNSEQSLSAFTLFNKGTTPFPAAGWTLYFSSGREMDDTRPTGGVDIRRVNGDVYKITPTASFRAIAPGDSTRIEYFSNGLLINYTAVPAGMYIVWDKAPDKGYSIPHFEVSPLKNTVEGVFTAERIFQQNSLIQDIPAAGLPKIFPTPAEYREMPGAFTLSAAVSIQSDSSFRTEAEYLAAELGRIFSKKIPVRYGAGPGSIVLQKEDRKEEAYRLSVGGEKIVLSAGSGAGIFYGIQSLWSLAPPRLWNGSPQHSAAIPAVEVRDEPRFGYRSLMLDVARNFKPKQQILKVLDLMALYKLNVLHFHFSDDEGWRIEMPSLPELTEVGAKRGHTTDSKTMLPASYASGPEPGKSLGSGYFTRADFIDILKYAKERHIRVIPEIETPGHSRAAIKAMDARYDRFMRQGKKQEAEQYLLSDHADRSVYSSAQQWTDNVMCVALPSVYRFLETVVDDLRRMYNDAGAPLTTIHLGGDEVPAGVWERSPACQALVGNDPAVRETDDLWYYYFSRVNAMLQSKGLFMSAWEEAGMRKTALDGQKTLIVNGRFADAGMQLHVWNNVVGWGAEDLPYRLANAGYKVVLSPVSNNYLDLAYFKHPDEPGFYWGGFQDIDKPFYFIPFDYYKTSFEGPDGNPVDPSMFQCKERLTDFGRSNIVGIEGLLWAENLRSVDLMEYMLLPKLLGVAERAWAPDPAWARAGDKAQMDRLYLDAWSVFVNVMGKRELPRLDYFAGGFQYRIPWPGAQAENGLVSANIQFPGLMLRYTTDGSEPTVRSRVYSGAIAEKGTVKIKAFDGRGRGSLTTIVENK